MSAFSSLIYRYIRLKQLVLLLLSLLMLLLLLLLLLSLLLLLLWLALLVGVVSTYVPSSTVSGLRRLHSSTDPVLSEAISAPFLP